MNLNKLHNPGFIKSYKLKTTMFCFNLVVRCVQGYSYLLGEGVVKFLFWTHLLFHFIMFDFVRVWPKKDPDLLWIRSNFTNPPLLLQRIVDFTSWKNCILWKFSLDFVHVFRTNLIFSTKFDSIDPSFNRSSLKLLYLTFKTSAHAKIVFIHHCIIISILLDMIWNLH